MSLDSNLQIQDPPRFTECVREGDRTSPPLADSREMAKRLQELVEQIQAQANPAARVLLQECLQTLLAFYGDGLSRIIEHLRTSGAEGGKMLGQLLQDQAVSGLLLIHGLHPIEMEARLRSALDKVRPYMQSHGGSIEFLGLENGVARVRLEGTCKTCPSSSITLELAVRRAVDEACPDLVGFEVEGMTANPPL